MAGVVALDLGRSGIRAVQVDSPYSDRPKISRFGAVAVPEGTIFDGEIIDERHGVTALKQLWKTAGFTTKKVTLGLANRKVVVREVVLPAVTGVARKAALRFAVEGQVPIDLDDSILDFLPLRAFEERGERKEEGLLVITARSSLESTVNAIEKAGCLVDAVDFAGFALMRALGNSDDTRAIVNVGASSTTIVIAAGAAPEFVRIVPSGGDDITRSLDRALGIGFIEAEQDKIQRGLQGGATSERDVTAESLVRESIASLIDSIRNTFNYYANAHPGDPVARIVLTGGGSRLTGLAPVFQRALGVPTSYGDPFTAFTVGRGVRDSGLDRWVLELAAPLGVTVGAK